MPRHGTTGPRQKPTALKLVQGTDLIHRGRLNQLEAKVAPGLPPAPAELSTDAVLEWNRVATRLCAVGLLTVIDGSCLAAYCQAYGRWVQAERVLADSALEYPRTHGLIVETVNGNPIVNPVLGVANKAMRDMVSYATEFGMSPSARSRVRASVEKQQDTEERFFG